MADRPFAIVGNGNLSGNTLTNVGNHTTNYHIYQHHERNSTLESRVSFDALLKSGARYPAPKCHPGTREKAQKVVKNWLCQEGEGSEKGIMWMSGAPGVGKSAIAQTVCEELCGDDGSTSWLSNTAHSERHVDGCFFFTRGFENREKVLPFPATIAFQLRRSRVSCRTAIDMVIAERPEILSQDFPSQFHQLLMKAAQATKSQQDPVTVVIDGLDECNSARDQVILLELILEAVKKGIIRVFIASRPEQQIHTFFHRPDVVRHTYQVRLDEETFQTNNDIKIYLREEFARIRRENPDSCLRLPNGEEWPGERVLDHLTLESDSQFMFPTLAVGFIDTPYFSPERQLQILLEAPPPGAFSALDTLYHKILSRQPPAHLHRGEEDLREYQEVVKGILRVIIAWSGDPLSAADIAVVLDKPPDVVQRIVRGPMRTLFKFHTSEPDSPITLCHKSLRDHLLARDRSQEFFIPSADEDDVFVAILSRRQTSHPAHPNIQGIVMDVLSFVHFSYGGYDDIPQLARSVRKIAEFLDVGFALVNYVINIGPTRLLFDVVSGRFEEVDEEDHEEVELQGDHEEEDKVHLCTSSFQEFLKNPDRSGPFFLSNGRTDALFIKALSRPPPSGSPYSFSRDIVLDILATLLQKDSNSITTSYITALLAVDSGLLKHVVTSGPVQWLVSMDEHHAIELINNQEVSKFVTAGDRSREFFVSPRRLDPVFIRILSKKSSSESSSHSISMDVLTAMLVVGEESTIHQITFLLSISRTLVEGVVKLAPTNLLFTVDHDRVSFSFQYFDDFLMDGSRSGPFFISTRRMDALIVPSLSRRLPPDSSSPYSRDILLDILAVTMVRGYGRELSTRQIAAFLDVDSSLVEHVVKFGTERWMFRVGYECRVKIAGNGRLIGLLLDADRSGHFFISDRRLDPYFVEILSRPSPIDPPHSELSSHEIVLRVLATTLAFEENLMIDGIASVIGVDPVCVETVVMVGPTKLLFAVEDMAVKIVWAFLEGFLQDATRSGRFFVSRSDIDVLFLHILTTSSPTVHPRPQELLMDVLSVMIMIGDLGATIDHVAAFLDIDSVLVDGVVSGPAKQLFQDGYGRIRLSAKLLGPFLQDVDRAGDFCITEARMDDLFTRYLSRQLSPNLPHSHAQHILKNVLCVLAHPPPGSDSPWTVSRLSAFLDMDYSAIEGVLYGPLALLFNSRWPDQSRKDVISLPPSPPNFWNDANRSGKFFISDNSLDPFFLRILSSPLPPTGSHSRPRDVLRDVLTLILVKGEGKLPVAKIADALDVNASMVDSVVQAGLPRLLFSIEWKFDTLSFSTTSIVDFLRDPKRSGEFCITDATIDALFIRILSHPPPSHLTTPLSKGDILRVMAVILASPEPLTVLKIAALLGVHWSIVEGVVEIMTTNVLFTVDEETLKFRFSGPFLKAFLHDPNRSGEFFIPPTITLDDIPTFWPLHPSTSPEVPDGEPGHVDGEADEEIKDQESPKGDSAGQSETAAGLDTPSQSPLAIQTLPASAPPKRKFSRLACSRQNSRDPANEVAASPSTPVRTKRPKKSGSFVLDSGEPQDLVGVDSDSDDVEAMIAEALLVDEWDAEAVGGDDVPVVGDDSSGMVVDRKIEA